MRVFGTTVVFILAAIVDSTLSFNEALRNGANDIIVVKRSDGSFASTNWEAQIGKWHSILVSREGKEVHIFVNNVPSSTKMIVAENGVLVFKDSESTMLTSDQLAEFNLQPGKNTGKYVCEELDVSIDFNVYLYQDSDKLVLTDIDGTITESDIKGHVYPIFGITAAHKKVIELFAKIRQQGYQVIYLTARSISMDEETHEYLFDLLQNQAGFSIPMGPVLLSPETFIDGIISEVVEHDPDVLKTQKILGISEAFSTHDEHNIMDTVVAAYGNKDSDVKAYVNSEIDLNNIYIVNTKGVLENIGTGEKSSYEQQVDKIELIYPDISQP